tara:strand:+ start:172 stop:483 length:312 start_codon:yes stop_codon:yes gene_type:complete
VYIDDMNDVIILKADNLEDYVNLPNLIVVFISPSCGSCKSLIPYLYKLDNKYNVVVVDSERHFKSVEEFYPKFPSFYPSILKFEEGKFKSILDEDNIKNIQLW